MSHQSRPLLVSNSASRLPYSDPCRSSAPPTTTVPEACAITAKGGIQQLESSILYSQYYDKLIFAPTRMEVRMPVVGVSVAEQVRP